MYRDVSAETSFLEVGEAYFDGGTAKIDVVGHLRTLGNKEFDLPRMVSYVFASDPEGANLVDGPDGASPGIQTELAAGNDGLWRKTFSNFFDVPFDNYLILILADGAVAARVTLPPSSF